MGVAMTGAPPHIQSGTSKARHPVFYFYTLEVQLFVVEIGVVLS